MTKLIVPKDTKPMTAQFLRCFSNHTRPKYHLLQVSILFIENSSDVCVQLYPWIPLRYVFIRLLGNRDTHSTPTSLLCPHVVKTSRRTEVQMCYKTAGWPGLHLPDMGGLMLTSLTLVKKIKVHRIKNYRFNKHWKTLDQRAVYNLGLNSVGCWISSLY